MAKLDISENSIFSGNDLQPLLTCDTLESAEAAFNDIMAFKKKEKFVLERHSNKISKREDKRHSSNFYYTRIKTPTGSKKISGSYTDLINELYEFYSTTMDKSKVSFSDIRKDYEAWFKVGRNPATVKVSNSSYKHIKGTLLDSTPICEIDYQCIKKFFQDFSKKHKGEYTRSMYEKLRTDIYNMLEYALEEDIISQRVATFNFSKSITVRFKQSEPRETWTINEHMRLLEYLDGLSDDIFALLFEYQLLTGDRFETSSAMLPGDVNADNLTVRIHSHQITADAAAPSQFEVVDGTKGNSPKGKRDFPILPVTLDVIRRAIALNPEGTYVFEFNGRPVNPTTYRKHVQKLCEAAGVPYHNPHSARNFAASMINNGDNIQEMCDYFGWSCAGMASLYGRNIADSDSALRANLRKIAHLTGDTPWKAL